MHLTKLLDQLSLQEQKEFAEKYLVINDSLASRWAQESMLRGDYFGVIHYSSIAFNGTLVKNLRFLQAIEEINAYINSKS